MAAPSDHVSKSGRTPTRRRVTTEATGSALPLSVAEIIASLPLLPPEEYDNVCLVIWNDHSSLVRRLAHAEARIASEGNALALERRNALEKLKRPKVRYADRNAEIVRLDEEEKRTFREIGKHFDMNEAAARAAYWNFKRKHR